MCDLFEIRRLLTYNFNSRQDNKESLEKQMFNIDAFASLDRTGLQYETKERRLILYKNDNEKVFIQYPGKETARSKQPRPWDFRPEAEKNGGTKMPNLSFADIWDDISLIHRNNDVRDIIAAIFFRMAYLIDHTIEEKDYEYEDFDVTSNEIVRTGKIHFKWYKPSFNKDLLDFLSSKVSFRDFSIEAYLIYNDLLAQNEDCKYFYREKYEKKSTWKGKPGRRNTLLSHLSVIEFLKGEISFSQIMGRFQSGFGVAPIPMGEVQQTTGNIIITSN